MSRPMMLLIPLIAACVPLAVLAQEPGEEDEPEVLERSIPIWRS